MSSAPPIRFTISLLSSATVAVLLLVSSARVAHADDDTFRCGSKLISVGMLMADVLAQCGEPDAKATESVPQMGRRANGSSYEIGTIVVESWTYKRGSSSFPALLKFEGSKLVSVELVRE